MSFGFNPEMFHNWWIEERVIGGMEGVTRPFISVSALYQRSDDFAVSLGNWSARKPWTLRRARCRAQEALQRHRKQLDKLETLSEGMTQRKDK